MMHEDDAAILNLSRSDDPVIRAGVAANPRTPARILRILAHDRAVFVREHVAQNPKLPLDLIQLFLPYQSEELDYDQRTVASAVLKNPAVPLRLLEDWLENSPVATEKHYLLADWLSNPNLSTNLLRRFVHHASRSYREKVAQHPQTSTADIAILAGDEESGVRWAVARRSDLSPAVITQLAQDHWSVAEALRGPQAPVELLRTFLHHPDRSVANALVWHPFLPVEDLSILAEHPDEFVRVSVAGHPKCWPGLLEQLAHDQRMHVRVGVAQNPMTPLSTLRQLRGDVSAQVRLATGRNWSLPEDDVQDLLSEFPELAIERNMMAVSFLSMFARHERVEVRAAVAAQLNTPVEVLRILARDDDRGVRSRALHHPLSPLDLKLVDLQQEQQPVDRTRRISELSGGELRLLNQQIQQQLAARTTDLSGTKQVFDAFRESHNPLVRAALTANPTISPAQLAVLAKDADPDVGWNVARHPMTPQDTLEKLSRSQAVRVRQGVAANPQTPLALLVKLADDPSLLVRYGVASHSATPPETLRTLTTDPNWQVKQAALENHHLPVEILLEMPEPILYLLIAHPDTPVEVRRKCYDAGNDEFHVYLVTDTVPHPDVQTWLLADQSAWVREAAASHLQLTPQQWESLLTDPEPEVRGGLAWNPSVPTDVIERLRFDASEVVQKELREAEIHRAKSDNSALLGFIQ